MSTASSSENRLPLEAHGVTQPEPHHHVPIGLIFVALVALTVVTVCVAMKRFDVEVYNVLLALAIAAVKGSLVALFFMHLKFEGKLIYLIFLVPLALCILLVCAMIPDVVMTGASSSSSSLHLFNAVPPQVTH